MTTANTYRIEVSGVPIEVTRKAVRNVNLRVHDDGSVHMSVPWRVSRETAVQLARERADWIREKREEVLARHVAAEHLWKTGEALDVWGRPTPIVLETNAAEGVRLVNGALRIRVQPLREGDEPLFVEHRDDMVEAFLAGEMRHALERVAPACERRVDRYPTSITIRRMKTRWGSCTPARGTIRLNTALAEQPPECLEMVLVHELCHLREANHGPRFHALMDQFCPGWQEVQRYLDEHPPRV